MEIKDFDRHLRRVTSKAAKEVFRRWRYREEIPNTIPDGKIIFLGTGGNPEAVFNQNPHTAGFIISLNGLRMYVDPGPGAVVRAKEMGLDLGSLDAVYVSHGHLDHYAGAESIIESMCWAMFARRGYLLGPREVLQSEGLISKYHQGEIKGGGYPGGPEVKYLDPYVSLDLNGAELMPVPAYHHGENYGFVLKSGNLKVGYTSDSNYIKSYTTESGEYKELPNGPIMDLASVQHFRKDLRDVFSDVDVLIANVTAHNVWAHRHITTIGLAHLLQDSPRVKVCFITHFNYCCLYPVDLRDLMAKYVEKSTGVKTIAAKDGAIYNIAGTVCG